MKNKKYPKNKLVLQKTTITSLDGGEMSTLQGGDTGDSKLFYEKTTCIWPQDPYNSDIHSCDTWASLTNGFCQ